VDDEPEHLVDGASESLRGVAAGHAELASERFLERVLRNERQSELLPERFGDRRLSRARRPGDDDEQRRGRIHSAIVADLVQGFAAYGISRMWPLGRIGHRHR